MKCIVLLLALFAGLAAQAKDYGVVGQTYEIAEQDLLEQLAEKIKQLQANGAWQTMQNQFVQQVSRHALRPVSHPLARARTNKTVYFNPAVTLSEDIQDAQGRVLIKQGTVVNPLSLVPLNSTLLFFNHDDKQQRQWIKKESQKHKQVKLILTAGSVKEASEYFKQAVYVDFNGYLIHRLPISALPARVKQAALQLQIDEVAL